MKIMTSFPVIALAIFAVVGVIFALWLRRVSELRDERIAGGSKDDTLPGVPQDPSQFQKGKSLIKKNQKTPLIIGGLVIFFLIASSLYEEFGDSAGGSGLNFAFFIPFLFVAFIPIMAANKKKKKQQNQIKLPEQYQNVLRTVGLLTAAIVIGTIVFLIFNQR